MLQIITESNLTIKISLPRKNTLIGMTKTSHFQKEKHFGNLKDYFVTKKPSQGLLQFCQLLTFYTHVPRDIYCVDILNSMGNEKISYNSK